MLSYRYIDDVSRVELNKPYTNLDSVYYLQNLKLEFSSWNNKSIKCLDVNMKLRTDNLLTSVYDKRNDFGFKTIKILHFDSYARILVCRNVFTNGLNRIERLSSTVSDLICKIIKGYNQTFMHDYPYRK